MIEKIVKQLTEERDRLNEAIALLTQGKKRRGRPPGSKNTPAEPESAPKAAAQSKRMKAYWKKKKAAK